MAKRASLVQALAILERDEARKKRQLAAWRIEREIERQDAAGYRDWERVADAALNLPHILI